ncbi:MAG: hypothetical protein FWB98_00655 [Defluviitaleaceae bacterium]|nr:hypothetical protein [Defluviitaleaceae bacterium]
MASIQVFDQRLSSNPRQRTLTTPQHTTGVGFEEPAVQFIPSKECEEYYCEYHDDELVKTPEEQIRIHLDTIMFWERFYQIAYEEGYVTQDFVEGRTNNIRYTTGKIIHDLKSIRDADFSDEIKLKLEGFFQDLQPFNFDFQGSIVIGEVTRISAMLEELSNEIENIVDLLSHQHDRINEPKAPRFDEYV